MDPQIDIFRYRYDTDITFHNLAILADTDRIWIVFLPRKNVLWSHSRNSQVTVHSKVYERNVVMHCIYLFSCLLLCKQQIRSSHRRHRLFP